MANGHKQASTHARTRFTDDTARRRRKGTLGCAPERARPKKRDDRPRALRRRTRIRLLACLYVHVFSLKIAGMVTAQGGTSTIVAKEIRSCAGFFWRLSAFFFSFFLPFFLEWYFERFFFFIAFLEILLVEARA